jgi:creatinine amidohydrolase
MITVENTWRELQQSGVDTAVLAFGTIEQHGHHLPLGTDWFVAEAMGRALAERLGAFLVPAMPFGNSREHIAFPGTLTLRPATLAAVLEDLVESLRQHGIRRIVVFSAHGGNWILKPTLRELNFQYPDLSLIWASGPLPDRGEVVPEDIHAGRGETSTLLHLRPELVHLERIEVDSPGIVGQEFNDYIGFDKTTHAGAWGKPSEASAELGQERFQQALDRQVDYIRWAFQRVEELKAGRSAVEAYVKRET